MIKKEAVLGLIVDSKNRMLLQRKDEDYAFWLDYWTIFGGEIEEKESEIDTLLREIKEELGINLKDTRFFCRTVVLETVKNFKFGGIREKETTISYFVVKFDGDLGKISLKEGAGYSIFTEDEIRRYGKLGLIVPHIYKVIEEYYYKSKEIKS